MKKRKLETPNDHVQGKHILCREQKKSFQVFLRQIKLTVHAKNLVSRSDLVEQLSC
jgi:hypothetical protein